MTVAITTDVNYYTTFSKGVLKTVVPLINKHFNEQLQKLFLTSKQY